MVEVERWEDHDILWQLGDWEEWEEYWCWMSSCSVLNSRPHIPHW